MRAVDDPDGLCDVREAHLERLQVLAEGEQFAVCVVCPGGQRDT